MTPLTILTIVVLALCSVALILRIRHKPIGKVRYIIPKHTNDNDTKIIHCNECGVPIGEVDKNKCIKTYENYGVCECGCQRELCGNCRGVW